MHGMHLKSKNEDNDVKWRRPDLFIVNFEHFQYFKGILMQIWKSLYYVCIDIKIISWKFGILNLKNSRVIRP